MADLRLLRQNPCFGNC